jgi:hypothetical protein
MYREEGISMSYLITCSGLTSAQRIKYVLERACISAYIVRPPQELSDSGCGYAVEVKSGQLETAVRIIKEKRLNFRRVFKKNGSSYSEVTV